MFYIIFEYIKFRIFSTNQHGIHSPFVYDLITNCFYDNQYYEDYRIISKYRNNLKKNTSLINVKDLGAGSKLLSSKSRRISDISKKAGITKKRAQLLYRLVKFFQPNSILELGTSLGMSTYSLSIGNPKAKIYTVEGCPETASMAKEQFKLYKLDNIVLIVDEFKNALDELKTNKFDLMFIDGNHQKESTITYFNTLLNSAKNDSIMIFDDIHWSKGMTQAWEVIKNSPKVAFTIDTFYWGFVFFRKGLEKQHFKIRL